MPIFGQFVGNLRLLTASAESERRTDCDDDAIRALGIAVPLEEELSLILVRRHMRRTYLTDEGKAVPQRAYETTIRAFCISRRCRVFGRVALAHAGTRVRCSTVRPVRG